MEDAIYHRMIRRYYRQETPLPTNPEHVARLVRATDQVEIVKAILLEFFTLADDGWHQGRCDKEIIRYREKQEKARNSALLGVAARQRSSERSANAQRTPTEGSAHQAPSTKHQTPEEAKAPDGDAIVILAAYHELLPACQQIAVLGPKRKRLILAAVKAAKQVCREQGWPYDAREFWRAYFAECAADPWLRGDKPNPNNPSWKQKLDTLLDETRFTAVMDKAIATMRRAA